MLRTLRRAPTAVVLLCCLGSEISAFAATDVQPPAAVSTETATVTAQAFATPTPGFVSGSAGTLPASASAVPGLMFNSTQAIQQSLPDASTRDRLRFSPLETNAFAKQVYQGRPYPMYRDRSASIAAMIIGAAASITGAAVLVYANRPECTLHQFASGCGYGTKVIGGAVLSGGVASIVIGAITWR